MNTLSFDLQSRNARPCVMNDRRRIGSSSPVRFEQGAGSLELGAEEGGDDGT